MISRSRQIIHDGIANRYIGDSNDILQEIMQAGFRVLDVEIVPQRMQKISPIYDAIATKLS
ncbi:MAG: hypothetical protein M1G31_01820 [Pseudanabaena sp. Salubria-1]|nr:hypothetical protein [Pseudanabaena sp. Salubria-1]